MSSFLSSGKGIPIWILSFLLLALAILAVIVYRTQDKGTRKGYSVPLLFRIGTFLTIIILLGDLALSWTSRLVKKPLVRVFLDNSSSVAYHQSVSTESLLDGYREIASHVQNSVESLPDGGVVEFYTFGSQIQPVAGDDFHPRFTEPVTDLSAVLKTATDVPPDQFLASAILVTDGQVTRGTDPREMAQEIDVPVHSIGIGDLTPMVDIHIEKTDAPTVGVRGDMVTAEVAVSSIGNFKERVHVSLSNGKNLLGSKMVTLTGQGSVQTVKFRFGLEESGSRTYAIQVAALKEEINIANNRLSFSIIVLKDRFTVALLTGAPSPTTSFIKRVLRMDPRFNTDHFVNHLNGWLPPMDPFWNTDYDLIILDNLPTAALSQRWLSDLVRKLERQSSALVLIPGPNVSMGKARFLYPLLGLQDFGGRVDVDRYYPISFSDNSHLHPIFNIPGSASRSPFATISLPPLKPYLLTEPGVSPMAVLVNLQGPVPIPLFSVGSVDRPLVGEPVRTASITTTDLWQLHFRVMRTDYADFVDRWWKRTFNWLVKSGGDEETYFRLNKETFQQGETVYVSGTLIDLGQHQSESGEVTMTIQDEHGEARSIPLTYTGPSQQWQGRFFAGKPGIYHYLIVAESRGGSTGKQTGTFIVEESQIELNRVFLNRKLLSDLSRQTGGIFLIWDDRLGIVQNLDFEPREIMLSQSVQLSHWLPLSVIALLFMMGEWISRRILGLQ